MKKTMRQNAAMIASSLTLGFVATVQAATIYVTPGGAGAQNGMSWSNAYSELQTALTNASAGSEIWVAAGTYRPDSGTNDRTMSFDLKDNVAVYGGYVGSETSRDQRNIAANVTVLSGEIGTQGDNSDNSHNVVFASNIGASSVLDGFTIQDGNALGDPSSFHAGGGVRIENASATVRNLVIQNCVANYGGGLVAFGAAPSPIVVTNVVLQGNVATETSAGGGGAFVGGDGEITFVQCQFIGNSAQTFGGGAYFESAGGGFVDCVFDGNSASDNGGGVGIANSATASINGSTFRSNSSSFGGAASFQSSQTTVEGCLFERNISTFVGGAIAGSQSGQTFRNCRFHGNTAVSAGAISLFRCTSRIDGCTFVGNTSQSGSGGAIAARIDPLTITNSTFTHNHATNNVGGVFLYQGATGTLANSILWNNQDANGTLSSSQIAWEVGNPVPTIQYCDFNGATGPTWMAVDPVFARNPFAGADGVWGTADDDYGDVRLSCSSPLVDAGSNALVAAGLTTDVGGRPRFVDNPGVGDTGNGTAPIVDLGAYESHSDIDCGACFPAGGGCVVAFAGHCNSPGDVFLGYDVSCGDPAFIVDRLAMPGGTGSAAAPFQLFAEAVAASPTGVLTTLYVRTSGHYPESVTFNKPTRFVNPTGQAIRLGN